MTDFLIGVDGGGSGTRVRLARADGAELAQGASGPSALSQGVDQAWLAVDEAVARAFENATLAQPHRRQMAIGLGMSGVHNRSWAEAFSAANPGYATLALHNDGFTTLLGAHAGQAGAIVAIGTGSVGQALLASGEEREVGGWGFPSGDEAGGSWIGLRAVNHMQQVIDGRQPPGAFATAIIDACGGTRDAIQQWLADAGATRYATLAPLVVEHAAGSHVAHSILTDAGREVARIAAALDPAGELPLALCGGLGVPLRAFLPPDLLARTVAPQGDSAAGALRMIARRLSVGSP